MQGIHIDIVTVTFNRADGLRKTLESLRNVSLSASISVYIIDGGSSDGTQVLVENYSDLVKYFVSERDKGIYDAMNKAVEQLPCEENHFTIFINSEDELLNIPIELFKNCYDLLFFPVTSFDESTGLNQNFVIKPQSVLMERNLLSPGLHHQGFFVRNTYLKKLRYALDVGIRGDVLFMAECLKMNGRTFFGDVPVSQITTGGISDQYTLRNFLAFFLVAKKLRFEYWRCIIHSRKELLKYFLKFLIGPKGIKFVRQLKVQLNTCKG